MLRKLRLGNIVRIDAGQVIAVFQAHAVAVARGLSRRIAAIDVIETISKGA